MKIRQGFVSNSSSTSFCIYGTEIAKLIENYIIDFDVETLNNNEEIEGNLYEKIDEIAQMLCDKCPDDLELIKGNEESFVFIGKSLSSLNKKENENRTFKEFRKDVETNVVNFLIREKIINEKTFVGFDVIEETIC